MQLTATSNGPDYRSGARVIEPGDVRRVPSVMGVRLFYGLMPDRGDVIEFVMTGGGFVGAERLARTMASTLFETTFASHRYEVEGQPRQVVRKVDLTPVQTTATALRLLGGWA